MAKQALRWLVARPIAHRGLHDLARDQPENTIAAFTAAIRAGYAIECDVRLSADGVPVIFHDDDLNRLTAESGPVDHRSAEELGRIHVLGSQEVIPTLDDMLAEVMGRVPLIIEMKPAGPRGPELAREVVKRVQNYDGPVALMSFDSDLVDEVRRLGRGGRVEWVEPFAEVPAVVAAPHDEVQLVVRVLAELTRPQLLPAVPGEALHVAVTEAVDDAAAGIARCRPARRGEAENLAVG